MHSEIEIDFGPAQEETFSADYWCLYSRQNIDAKNNVHVFIGSCPVEQLKKNKDIMLVDDLRGEKLWGMHKLVQRNISNERVNDILKNYLKSKNKSIKFFPAITVVLLPVANNQPKDQYDYDPDGFQEIKGIIVNNPQKGAVKPQTNFPAKIKWSLDNVAALVVDGQHRVKAIRDYYEPAGQGAGSENSLPVAFVVFDKDADLSVIDATRQLFIDINNTPKRVSEQKLIFIDDRSVLRRVTSKTLGVLDPGEDAADPYQIFEDEQCFKPGVLNGKLNKYLVGEDGHDDEDYRTLYRSHGSLFPWEITHIMTLHEEIIQKILLADGEIVDGLPSLTKISRTVSKNLCSFIDSAEMKDLEDDEIQAKLNELRRKGRTEGEVEVVRKHMLLQQEYLRQIEELDQDSEDYRDEKNALKKHLDRMFNSSRSFEYPVARTNEIINSSLIRVVNIVSAAFNEMDFVKEVIDLFENGTPELSATNIFRYVSYSKQKCSGLSTSGAEKRRLSLDSYIASAELDDKEEDALRACVKNISDKLNNNLLTTLVGQQALFGWLVSKDNRKGGDLSYLEKNVAYFIGLINRLSQAELFHKNKKLSVVVGGEVFMFSPFEGVIMKAEKMLPGTNNALKAIYLLNMIEEGVSDRVDVDINPVIGVRHFDSVIKSMGSRAYHHYSQVFTQEEILEKLLQENEYKGKLKEDDFSNMSMEASPAIKESVAKKALGVLMLTKIVETFNPIAIGSSPTDG